MTGKPQRDSQPAPRFRTTLFMVMAVQVLTLVVLWILQQRYTP